MEVPNGHKHRDLICIYEAFGTAFLLISVNWGALGGSQAVAVAFGIFGYITVMSPICGSNFNPAVTLGILIKDTGSSFRENLITALCTITAQIAGGFLGVLFVLIAVNMDVPIE
jgi:glycerol uptake facilitator-like aquaporin